MSAAKPPGAAWGFSGLAVALVAVVFVVAGLWLKAESARGEAETARLRVEDLFGTEQRLRGDLRGAYGKLEEARKEVTYLNYAHAVDLAFREYRANNIARAVELLEGCPADLRGWEWDYVHRLCHQDIVTLHGHAGPVTSASLSADGKRIVTGSPADGTARIWDAETGRELVVLKGHTAGVRSVSFSADGRRVVTGSEDGTARVWDADTGKWRSSRATPHWPRRSARRASGGHGLVDSTARTGDGHAAERGPFAPAFISAFSATKRVVTDRGQHS